MHLHVTNYKMKRICEAGRGPVVRDMQPRKLHLAVSLIECIEECNLRGLALLLRNHDVDPNFILPDKLYSPIHVVAAVKNESFAVKALELLFENGGDPNVCADESLTPVHVAASWDHGSVLHFLLENGGNPLFKDLMGKDAFDYVQDNECIAAKQVLAEFEATRKLLMRMKKIQSCLPGSLSSYGRSRRFFRPSVLAKIPDLNCENPSSDKSIVIVREVCEDSEPSTHTIRLFSLSEHNVHYEENEKSVLFVEDVCHQPQHVEKFLLSIGKVADHSHKKVDLVDVASPRSVVAVPDLSASDEHCWTNSMSLGNGMNLCSFSDPCLSSEDCTSVQSDAGRVGETIHNTCTKDDDPLLNFVASVSNTSKDISGINLLPEQIHLSRCDLLELGDQRCSFHGGRDFCSLSLTSFEEHEQVFTRESIKRKKIPGASLRKSLMPVINEQSFNVTKCNEESEDDGLGGATVLSSCPHVVSQDMRRDDWINSVKDNHQLHAKLEKSRTSSENEHHGHLDSACFGTFETCGRDLVRDGVLNTGALGLLLETSSAESGEEN